MKLASYNIQYGKGKDGQFDLARIVSELGDPDLIALQEVETFTARSGMVHQAEEIAARLPHMHWVYGPGIDLDASEIVDGKPVHRRRQFGNMVLSRWPILSSINHTLPKIALLNTFHLQRTLVECVIDAPSGPLRFCSVHLDHVSTDTRRDQVEYMCDLLLRGHERGASAGGVVGDLSHMHGRTIRAHGLADAWTLAGHSEGDGDTIPKEGRGPRRIDHCFVTTDLAHRIQSMEIGSDAQGSDHQPIFVTLDL